MPQAGVTQQRPFDDQRVRRKVLEWRDTVGDDRLRHLQRRVKSGMSRALILHNHPRDIPALQSNARRYFLHRRRGRGLQGERRQAHRAHPDGRRRDGAAAGRSDATDASRHSPDAQRSMDRDTHLQARPAGLDPGHDPGWRNAVGEWRNRLKLLRALKLYDARATAATWLPEAGAELSEIATHMGWSIKHASDVTEHHAAVSPGMTESLGAKLPRQSEADSLGKL
jgi:hypothetical protein